MIFSRRHERKCYLGSIVAAILLSLAQSLIWAQEMSELNQRITTAVQSGDFDTAVTLTMNSLNDLEAKFGELHPATIQTIVTLGQLELGRREVARASCDLERARRLAKQIRHLSLLKEATHTLFSAYDSSGQCELAIPAWSDLIELQLAELGPTHVETLFSKILLGDNYLKVGRANDAVSLHREVFNVIQVHGRQEPIDEVMSGTRLANALIDAGKPTEALNLVEELLKSVTTKPADYRVGVMDMLHIAADVRQSALDWEGAIDLLKESQRRALEGEISKIGLDLYRIQAPLISALLAAGHQREARQLSQAVAEGVCQEIASGKIDRLPVATNIVDRLISAADLGFADKLLSQILVQHRDANSVVDFAVIDMYHQCIELRQKLGDFVGAVELAEELVSRAEKQSGIDSLELVIPLNRLAPAYAAAGFAMRALDTSLRALELRHKNLGYKHSDTAASMLMLGVTAAQVGQYEFAMDCIRRAFWTWKELGINPPPAFLVHLASVSELADDPETALAAWQDALRFYQANEVPAKNPDVVLCRLQLGDCLGSLGRWQEALKVYQEALVAVQSSTNLDLSLLSCALRSIAVAEKRTGSDAQAHTFAKQALEVEIRLLANVLESTAESEKLTYLRTNEMIHTLGTLGFPDLLATWLVKTKGLVLDSVLTSARATAEQPEREEKLVSLRAARAQLTQLSIRLEGAAAEPVLVAQKKAVIQEINELERELGQSGPGRGDQGILLETEVRDVQTVLPRNGALIDFVRYRDRSLPGNEERYGGLVLGDSGEPRWIQGGNCEPIDAAIARMQQQVAASGSDEEMRKVLEELNERLVAPLWAVLSKSVTTLIVSPDAELNFVPFVALRNQSGEFLGERVRIAYVAAGRDLLRDLSKVTTDAKRITCFGDPSFGTAAPVADGEQPGNSLLHSRNSNLLTHEFTPLPGTRTEVRRIADVLKAAGWQTQEFTGEKATEEELRRLSPTGILHLATHGFYAGMVLEPDEKLIPRAVEMVRQNKSGEKEVVTLSFDKAAYLRSKRERPPEAALTSGLLFAGAETTLAAWRKNVWPNPDRDGLLLAPEVVNLNLRGVCLVTLSACETGVGRVESGQGVFGLRRAFMQAGAQNILSTLWPIADDPSVEIMEAMYSEVGAGHEPWEALQRTQLQFLKKFESESGLTCAIQLAAPFVLNLSGRGAQFAQDDKGGRGRKKGKRS